MGGEFMYINKNYLMKSLLCSPVKFPMYNSHYLCGKDIYTFSNLMCVENSLTNITCNLKNICGSIKNLKI